MSCNVKKKKRLSTSIQYKKEKKGQERGRRGGYFHEDVAMMIFPSARVIFFCGPSVDSLHNNQTFLRIFLSRLIGFVYGGSI